MLRFLIPNLQTEVTPSAFSFWQAVPNTVKFSLSILTWPPALTSLYMSANDLSRLSCALMRIVLQIDCDPLPNSTSGTNDNETFHFLPLSPNSRLNPRRRRKSDHLVCSSSPRPVLISAEAGDWKHYRTWVRLSRIKMLARTSLPIRKRRGYD